eukprot:259223_1
METWLRKHNLLNLLPVIQKEGITIQFIKGCTEEDIRLCSTEISPSVIQRTKFIVACRDYIDIHTPSIHPPTMAPYSNTNNADKVHPPTMAPFVVPNNRANPSFQVQQRHKKYQKHVIFHLGYITQITIDMTQQRKRN